ncbi:MAG: prolyl-tRNA synthetase associated domain-containing protein [Lachnospiraceae bacterium]|nr:prolyl-tRNA synthetase associated domain-containing protein [Lachnospiraceae bacterium]
MDRFRSFHFLLRYRNNIKYYKAKRGSEMRQEKELAVYSLLEKLGIEYTRVDHEAANTMEACQEIDKQLGVFMCKNLFLCNRQKTEFYLLLMPGDKPFKTKDLSAQIGSARLSFADAEFMEKYLNILPGAVSVMGLMNDVDNKVKLLIDREVAESEYIGCHPCVNTSSLKIMTKDIMEKFLSEVNHEATIVDLPCYESVL